MSFGGLSFGGVGEAGPAPVGAVSSPAMIARQYLVDSGLLPAPAEGPQTALEWASFVGFLPDVPDTAAAIYDTQGMMDGRVMTGEKITHPGIQIRFRSPNYRRVWERAALVRDALDLLNWASIDVLDETWLIQNMSRTSDIISMGVEEIGDRKRHNLVINAIMTLKQTYATE